MKLIVCGGAALRPEVGEFFNSIGIEFFNGYGITECSPVVAVNRNKDYRDGSVGKLIKEQLPGSFISRIGGDEFVMLLVSDSRDRHLEFSELFNKAISEEAELVKEKYPFGASFGICCINEEKNLPLMACIQMADKRMYTQKKNKKVERK